MSESTKNIIRAKGRPMLYREGKTASLETEYYPAQETEVYGDKQSTDFNKIFWWDNFQVLCNLMKEYRGRIDLIYIDPPFDSKADYVKKIKFRWQEIIWREQSLLEETQYSDIRWNDEYLQFMYERLLLLRELLTDWWSIYLHMDEKRSHYLKIIMDEVFWVENFQREIIWRIWRISWYKSVAKKWIRNHDSILFYSKDSSKITFNKEYIAYPDWYTRRDWSKPEWEWYPIEDTRNCSDLDEMNSIQIISFSWEKTGYPTQKNENLLTRIIKASSNPWDIVLDCFMWSGTTCAVAQKLWRRWIGCDINTWAINTTIKRLNQIIEDQDKNLWETMISSPLAFKVYNVNEYNLFKNKEEGIDTYKQIIMESYGVSAKRGYRDGETSSALVKIIDPNRILSKKDIEDIIQNIDDTSDDLIYSKSPLKYKDIQIICSGKELDSDDYIIRAKREWKLNKDVDIQIKDLLVEKEGLLFKEKPYIEYKLEKTEKVSKENWESIILTITDFISPVLLKKLDIENKWKSDKIMIEDRKQAVDSIAIDIDYDWVLFNAEIIDSPSKKELVQWIYDLWSIKEGIIAIKMIDILWEELFLTIDKTEKKTETRNKLSK